MSECGTDRFVAPACVSCWTQSRLIASFTMDKLTPKGSGVFWSVA